MTKRVFVSIALAALFSSLALAQQMIPDEISWEKMFRGSGKISLRVDPSAFSPDDDGKQDSAFFFLGTQGVLDLSKWAIVLENSRGHTVRRISGKGSPPGLTEWNGTNSKNALLPEGVYGAKAYVWGRGGKTVSPKIQVIMDNTPPRLNVTLSTPSFSPGDPSGNVAVSIIANDNSALARWTVMIFVKDHPDVEVFSASGAFAGGQAAISWNGLNSQTGQTVPHGPYSVRAAAQDVAGNETIAPTIDVEVVVKPESILKQLSETLALETTIDGLKLTVPSTRLFANKYSDELSDESLPLRQRLLYLVQSYPAHNIILEGHAGSEKSGQERASLSSAQAWALYSFLVKSGVAATRLNVQGLGGTRDEDNRIIIRFRSAAPTESGADPSESPVIGALEKSTSTWGTGAKGVFASSASVPSENSGVHP